MNCDVIIIGAGIAGLSAAIYAASEGAGVVSMVHKHLAELGA